MKKQSDIPETLRDEMRRAVIARWAKTTPEQRSEFARMLWARRVRKHKQAALGLEARANSAGTK